MKINVTIKMFERFERNREIQSKYYNKGKIDSVKYNVGDLVMVKDHIASTGYSRKLRPRYRGPYQITKILDKDRYVVEDIGGKDKKLKPIREFCHQKDLNLHQSKRVKV